MLPFSKRPPPPEEYFLRSGDFEAVSPTPAPSQGGSRLQPSYGQAGSGGYAAIPPAPRTPVFARQAQPTPYGFAQHQHQHQPYGQYGDLSAPPPPHSLAPVAMGYERHASATGTNRSQGTVVIREKPSLKWGVMIAVTGALLGGVLGLGMDARRQSARAAAAAEARDVAPPVMVATALPQAPAPVAPALAAPAPAPKPVVVSSLAATAVAPAPAVAAAAAPVVIAPSAGVVVTPAPAAKPEAKTAKAAPAPVVRHFSAPVRPTVSVAAKVPQPKPEPVVKAEPAPSKADKADKADKPAKKDPGTKAAQDLLEQANKDTTNTL